MSGTNVPSVTDATFETEVLKSSKPTLVDFTATWCPPCKAVAPILDKLAAEVSGTAKIVAVDTDENRETAARYNIRYLPTLALFRDGKLVAQITGAAPEPKIRELLRS